MAIKRRFEDLNPTQRGLVVAAGVAQLALAAVAAVDLARRPAAQVRGPKPLWAVALCVNFVGPISYLAFGRRR